MKKYLRMSSAAVMIGALRVKTLKHSLNIVFACVYDLIWKWTLITLGVDVQIYAHQSRKYRSRL